MIDPRELPMLALQIAVDIYATQMAAALRCLEDGGAHTQKVRAAAHHFQRADAAHFMVGLLFDAVEAQADEMPGAKNATPIHVAEGSSHLPAPDAEAALVLNTLAPEALRASATVLCAECFNSIPDTKQDELTCAVCGAVMGFDGQGSPVLISPATRQGEGSEGWNPGAGLG